MVDKVGQVNQVPDAYKSQARPKAGDAPVRADSVEISSAARTASIRQAVASVVADAPAIRADRVKQAKEHLERGDYLSDRVIERVADRIADSILGPSK